jgi:hypothetical protein
MSLKSFLRRITKNTLVYWEKTGSSNSGQSTFKSPVEMKCRWEDVQEEVELIDGRKVISNAHLISLSKFILGSIVWQGTMAQFKKLPTYPSRPTATQGGKEIFKVNHTPGFKGEELLWEAFL